MTHEQISIHVHAPGCGCNVATTLAAILERTEVMSAALDRITQEVQETKTAVDSVLALVAGMAQQIRDLKDDPAALELLADDLDAKQAEIAAAVSANTPTT